MSVMQAREAKSVPSLVSTEKAMGVLGLDLPTILALTSLVGIDRIQIGPSKLFDADRMNLLHDAAEVLGLAGQATPGQRAEIRDAWATFASSVRQAVAAVSPA